VVASLVGVELRGANALVRGVRGVSQWAEIHRTALGLGSRCPNSSQLRWNSLCSIAFIGSPCPMNTTGIRGAGMVFMPTYSAHSLGQADLLHEG